MRPRFLRDAYNQGGEGFVLKKIFVNFDFKSILTELNKVAENGWLVEEQVKNAELLLGGAHLVSTAPDLCKFINALLKGRLVSPASLAQMKDFGDREYGFGLYPTMYNGKFLYGHSGGSVAGYTCVGLYYPDEDISIAVTLNYSDYGPMAIARDVISTLTGDSFRKLP